MTLPGKYSASFACKIDPEQAEALFAMFEPPSSYDLTITPKRGDPILLRVLRESIELREDVIGMDILWGPRFEDGSWTLEEHCEAMSRIFQNATLDGAPVEVRFQKGST